MFYVDNTYKTNVDQKTPLELLTKSNNSFISNIETLLIMLNSQNIVTVVPFNIFNPLPVVEYNDVLILLV